MRTTIELRDEHRARLLELAARRGEMGFSALIAEALDAYLGGMVDQQRRVAAALRVQGTLPAKEAARMRAEIRPVRESWR